MNWSVPSGSTEVDVQIDGDDRETVVVLAHGAGTDLNGKTVLMVRDLILRSGAAVVRFNFPYKQERRSLPDKMPTLMDCYRRVVADLRDRISPEILICGGHSMGGRTASMLAAEGFEMNGLLLISYPLHPAGKPEKLRDAHLPDIQCATLCVNGTQDDLCTPEIMEQVLQRVGPNWQMHWVEHADHSLKVTKATGRTNADVQQEIQETIGGWLDQRRSQR